MKTLKIDQFYFVLGAFLILLAILVTFTLKTIFGSINKAQEIDTESMPQTSNNISIDGVLLDKTVKSVYQRQFVPLDLK